MNQVEALHRIERLGVSDFETRDIAALLRVSPANASVLLGRLARRGFVRHLSRGRWGLAATATRERIVERISAPYPAYVSLQSALFRHGMIEQIPDVLYAVTLGRAKRVTTPLGVVSLHRIPPDLFGGFEMAGDGGKLATPEKALFDLCYLAPARSRLFARFPEVEIPRSFRWAEVHGWIRRIAGRSRRVFVEKKVAEVKARTSVRRE